MREEVKALGVSNRIWALKEVDGALSHARGSAE
jgi:hypothetical protein